MGFHRMRIALTTGALCSSHGRLPTAATLTPPHIATTTVTWWGRRTHGATIGIVAASNSGSSTADNCEATTGNRLCCSEVFTNCAEVKLVEESGSATHATPAPTPAPTPGPSQIEPEPEPEPEPEAEAEPEPSPQPEPTQTPPEGTSCIGEPCSDPTHCRSKWGSCGSGSAYCNAESIWKPTGCSSPDAATGSCTGEPCSDASHCRSKWGHCGSTAAYCNADSTWTANGCLSLVAHRHEVAETRTVRRHRRFLGTSLIQASSKHVFGVGLPVEDL